MNAETHTNYQSYIDKDTTQTHEQVCTHRHTQSKIIHIPDGNNGSDTQGAHTKTALEWPMHTS